MTTMEKIHFDQIAARDQTADDKFCYAVVTTGIYCRPSCGARTPNPANIRFFPDPAAAEAAGFRACKRCRPDRSDRGHGPMIARLCALIEAAEQPPTLPVLAREAGLSPAHLQRVFKSAIGVTPRAYAAAHRASMVRTKLSEGSGVTAAMYDAGFNSSGRFYEAAPAILGMTASSYRSGAAGENIRFALGRCSLGEILVACTDRGICAILLGDEPEPLVADLRRRFAKATIAEADDALDELLRGAIALVDQPTAAVNLPLDVRGTVFQQRVWQALRNIVPGATKSYGEIAREIGAPGSVRAVAAACAANLLAVAVPCHRAVRQNGGLAGYRLGIARKRDLLAREKDR